MWQLSLGFFNAGAGQISGRPTLRCASKSVLLCEHVTHRKKVCLVSSWSLLHWYGVLSRTSHGREDSEPEGHCSRRSICDRRQCAAAVAAVTVVAPFR